MSNTAESSIPIADMPDDLRLATNGFYFAVERRVRRGMFWNRRWEWEICTLATENRNAAIQDLKRIINGRRTWHAAPLCGF